MRCFILFSWTYEFVTSICSQPKEDIWCNKSLLKSPKPFYYKFSTKNSLNLANGIFSIWSYKVQWPASFTIYNSLGSLAYSYAQSLCGFVSALSPAINSIGLGEISSIYCIIFVVIKDKGIVTFHAPFDKIEFSWNPRSVR